MSGPANSFMPKRDALLKERMAALEEDQVVVHEIANTLQKRFLAVSEIIEAMIRAHGDEYRKELDGTLKKVHAENEAKFVEAQKQEIQEWLATKQIVTADKVSDKTHFVAGRVLDKEGNEVAPGRHQYELAQVAPEQSAALMGQAPGYVLETPNGKFELQEVYDLPAAS